MGVNSLHRVSEKSEGETTTCVCLDREKRLHHLLMRVLTLIDEDDWIEIDEDSAQRIFLQEISGHVDDFLMGQGSAQTFCSRWAVVE